MPIRKGSFTLAIRCRAAPRPSGGGKNRIRLLFGSGASSSRCQWKARTRERSVRFSVLCSTHRANQHRAFGARKGRLHSFGRGNHGRVGCAGPFTPRRTSAMARDYGSMPPANPEEVEQVIPRRSGLRVERGGARRLCGRRGRGRQDGRQLLLRGAHALQQRGARMCGEPTRTPTWLSRVASSLDRTP